MLSAPRPARRQDGGAIGDLLVQVAIYGIAAPAAAPIALVVSALSVYYMPALIYMVVPKKASSLLARMTEWILANSRMIEIVVGLGFGAMFLYKGLVVLL